MRTKRNLVPKDKLDILGWTREKLPPYLTKYEVRRALKVVEGHPLNYLLSPPLVGSFRDSSEIFLTNLIFNCECY